MKNILIYGDYSGYGKSLAKGFRENGYYCEVFNPFGGDGFKKIESDFFVPYKCSKIERLFRIILLTPKILKYDVYFIMNPAFMRFIYFGPMLLLLLKLLNKKIVLLCCGDDVPYIYWGTRGKLNSWVYDKIQLPRKKYFQTSIDKLENWIVASMAEHIIPTMYDYAEAWRLTKFSHKVRDTVPLACDGEVNNNKKINQKIKIMHGITRADVKGSKNIIAALDALNDKYGETVEITIVEKLPYSDYMRLIREVDISVDQSRGNSYGMNAIYSMLNGHVVLTCANKFCLQEFCLDNIPVIPIIDNKDYIFKKLEELVLNKESIDKLQNNAKIFASTFHSPARISKELLKYI
ncbi:hypothetical protein HVV49_17235 [Citrobacter freundii]|uniref:hypothetical protein n=1 Tax=Citrobacter portucalensis TaxID=1639133 RepID=UPI00180C5EAF|nr:hypothetical protein [Citrobacter portucalensis]MBA8562502.1 hypothetical protein [Citrobacter freundii]HBK4929727.1 hypothetical protein [Citrobacter freundii]